MACSSSKPPGSMDSSPYDTGDLTPTQSGVHASQGRTTQDSADLTLLDSAIPISHNSTVRSEQESSTFLPLLDSAVKTSFPTVDLDQSIEQYIDKKDKALKQAALHNGLIRVKDEIIATLCKEIDSKNTTITDLQDQVKQKDDALSEMNRIIGGLRKTNSTKYAKIRGLEATVKEQDRTLLEKKSKITDLELSNSASNHKLASLELEVRSKTGIVASLERNLCNNIVKREKLEQDIERLHSKIEGSQSGSLRGRVTGYVQGLRRSPRPLSAPDVSDRASTGILPTLDQDSASHSGISQNSPSNTPHVPGQPQAGASLTQTQGSILAPASSQKPTKAVSADWSTIAVEAGYSPRSGVREEVDLQVFDKGVRGWLKNV